MTEAAKLIEQTKLTEQTKLIEAAKLTEPAEVSELTRLAAFNFGAMIAVDRGAQMGVSCNSHSTFCMQTPWDPYSVSLSPDGLHK